MLIATANCKDLKYNFVRSFRATQKLCVARHIVTLIFFTASAVRNYTRKMQVILCAASLSQSP